MSANMYGPWIALFLLYNLSSSAAEFKCFHIIQTFYTDLGCKPIYTSDPDCPSSYDCGAPRSKGKCYLNGTAYEMGTFVSQENATLPHPSHLICECVYSKCTNDMTWTCKRKHCLEPAYVSNEPYEDETCSMYTFVHDDFCTFSFKYCEDKGILKKNITCHYGGKTYDEGQTFFPLEDATCLECVCAPGFNGSLVPPFCRQIFNQRLIQFTEFGHDGVDTGAAPIFITPRGCKAAMFRHPNDTDTIIPAKTKSSNQNLCHYCKKTLNVGDRLSPYQYNSITSVDCTCEIPPSLTCQFNMTTLDPNFFDFIKERSKWNIAKNRLEINTIP